MLRSSEELMALVAASDDQNPAGVGSGVSPADSRRGLRHAMGYPQRGGLAAAERAQRQRVQLTAAGIEQGASHQEVAIRFRFNVQPTERRVRM